MTKYHEHGKLVVITTFHETLSHIDMSLFHMSYSLMHSEVRYQLLQRSQIELEALQHLFTDTWGSVSSAMWKRTSPKHISSTSMFVSTVLRHLLKNGENWTRNHDTIRAKSLNGDVANVLGLEDATIYHCSIRTYCSSQGFTALDKGDVPAHTVLPNTCHYSSKQAS